MLKKNNLRITPTLLNILGFKLTRRGRTYEYYESLNMHLYLYIKNLVVYKNNEVQFYRLNEVKEFITYIKSND